MAEKYFFLIALSVVGFSADLYAQDDVAKAALEQFRYSESSEKDCTVDVASALKEHLAIEAHAGKSSDEKADILHSLTVQHQDKCGAHTTNS